MKAILLAAGYGTRLKPLTDRVPKCLIPVNGRPLLGHLLDLLRDGGIDRVLVNTHHLHEEVDLYLRRCWPGFVDTVYEPELLGTAGTVKANYRRFTGGFPVLVMHADNYTEMSVRNFIECHYARPKDTDITMAVFQPPKEKHTQCGMVGISNQIVVDLQEKPARQTIWEWANAAAYIFEPNVIDDMERDLEDLIHKYLGRVNAWKFDGPHYDIGWS